MTQQTIGIGAATDDKTGDTLRNAFDKVNDNFTELYTYTSSNVFYQGGSNVTISSGNITLNPLYTYVAVPLTQNIGNIFCSNTTTTNQVITYTLEFTANGSSYTVNWPNFWKWPANTRPTMTSVNHHIDVVTVKNRYTGNVAQGGNANVWLASYTQNFYN